MDLQIEHETLKRGYVLVSLAGDLDAYNSRLFRQMIENLFTRKKHKLIVDLESVTCIDSVGVGELLGSLRRIREKEGELSLVYDKSCVKKFLGITGLDANFTVFRTRREAIEELIIHKRKMNVWPNKNISSVGATI